MKKITSLALGLLLVLGAWGTLEAQKTKTVDGVKYILNGTNPKAPKGVPTKISFKEDLTVGGGEDPETSFAEVGFFVVAENGHIYASDVKDRKIKVYDAQGNFVRILGKEGQGPGELGMPSMLQLSPNNEIMVEDATNRKLSYFSLDGEFIREFSTVKSGMLGLTTLVLGPQGQYVGRQIGMEEQKMFFEVKAFDAELNPLFAIAKTLFPIPVPGSGNKMNLLDFIQVYMFDSKGNLLYGVNKEYEIQLYNGEGKHFLSVQKDFKAIKVTQKDIDEIMDRMSAFSGMAGGVNFEELFEFPDHFPPYQGFILDEEDSMYVRTWEKGELEDEYWTDVFDQEGRFFTRFVSKSDMRIIKGDTAYGIEENEDGYRLIKRYKITWSD